MHRTSRSAALCLSALFLMAPAVRVHAVEEVGWRDAQGNPLPESDSLKNSKGFGGSVILTADPDWREKWARPEAPHFTTADEVKLGESIVALVFFTNPGRDARGEVDIHCDYLVLRPDGSVSQEVKDASCARGKLAGGPYNVRLVDHLIGFQGEAGDLEGTWVIKVRLRDAVRDASVDLLAKFDYSASGAAQGPAGN
jgi:hypothetical protein